MSDNIGLRDHDILCLTTSTLENEYCGIDDCNSLLLKHPKLLSLNSTSSERPQPNKPLEDHGGPSVRPYQAHKKADAQVQRSNGIPAGSVGDLHPHGLFTKATLHGKGAPAPPSAKRPYHRRKKEAPLQVTNARPKKILKYTGGSSISTASNVEMTVVIWSWRVNGTVTPAEVVEIQKHLICELGKVVYRPGAEPEKSLQFREHGCTNNVFWVIAENEQTRDWLLKDCQPPMMSGDKKFSLISEINAPWPVKVALVLKCQERPDVQITVEFLYGQNLGNGFNIRGWEHVETCAENEGKLGNWRMIFLISPAEFERLQQTEGELFYQLATLKVFKLGRGRELVPIEEA